MSNSVRPHRQQPTSLPQPWDSPGKNTGVGCHFLFQCTKVKSESEAAQSCPTLSDPMDCSLPGSSSMGFSRQGYWSGVPGFPIHQQPSPSQNLVKLMFIESMMPSNHLILCHPLLPSSIFPSIRVFSNEPVLRIRWPKYWSFSFSISPSKEYSGFPLELTGLISLQSRDSKESSPMLQFKSINSSALSFLCSPSSHIHT